MMILRSCHGEEVFTNYKKSCIMNPIAQSAVGFVIMDFSLLTTSGVSQKRNEAVGNTKPPAMRVEDKLLYKKITFPL